MSTRRQRAVTATTLGVSLVLVGLTGVAPVASGASATPSTATGTVFFPNPVQQLGKQGLTDRKDADYAALQAAYRARTLRDLDGSGTLRGRYVTVKSATGKAVHFTPGGTITPFHRDANQFEQVMGYYWVTEAQEYLRSLGFGTTRGMPAVNARQIELRINQFGGDNSFFRDDKANITLGKGGVDDAEDAEVIVHEYGHSVQDGQVPGFGTNLESGSIGEGFGDYLAVAVTSWRTGRPTRTPEACVADWDSVSYTSRTPHCLRRLDGDKHYPQDVVGEVHADGEMWSAALYDIRRAIGATKADRIIVGAQFRFTPGTSFAAAARNTVTYAHDTAPQYQAQVRAAFVARGFLH